MRSRRLGICEAQRAQTSVICMLKEKEKTPEALLGSMVQMSRKKDLEKIK